MITLRKQKNLFKKQTSFRKLLEKKTKLNYKTKNVIKKIIGKKNKLKTHHIITRCSW